MSRGGLQFMLIIWLQGIWLPQHGYSFERTPLWAGIYLIPLTVGFLLSGPASGILSDRFGARGFATTGLLVSAASFLLLELLPMDFNYVWFALLILMFALGSGMFFSPNQAAVMNSVPPDQRGAGAGMLNTFQNSASVLSIGVFFTIITLGLASSLPSHLYSGLVAQGVPSGAARTVSHLPPIGSLFAAFLGYNPIQQLLGNQHTLQTTYHLNAAHAQYLLGRSFFPKLISQPFANGLHLAFDFAAGSSVIAAVASLLRGGRYVHGDTPGAGPAHESLRDEVGEGLAGAGMAAATGSGAGEALDESGILIESED
jgi:MFS family permease